MKGKKIVSVLLACVMLMSSFVFHTAVQAEDQGNNYRVWHNASAEEYDGPEY